MPKIILFVALLLTSTLISATAWWPAAPEDASAATALVVAQYNPCDAKKRDCR